MEAGGWLRKAQLREAFVRLYILFNDWENETADLWNGFGVSTIQTPQIASC